MKHSAIVNLFGRAHLMLLLLLAVAACLTLNTPHTSALSGGDWKAGDIIDDSLFYDKSSMSVADIQSFLNSKVPVCDTNGTQKNSTNPNMTNAQYAASQGWPGPPYVCLRDYMQVPRSDTIIDNFSGSTPSGSLSAAQIIKDAADSWGISPKVILVTLHKESLNIIYDSWPIQYQYKNAMGYGCPDTAPCDPKYAGFYNQVNNAAYQFLLYKQSPNNYRYKPFQVNTVYYNPNSSCGASNINIQNYATAGLYNYTPYQPNQAALNNLYGTGDSCSAYGNRNFWRVFNDWFGNTTGTFLIQSPASSVVYIKSGNTRYGVPSWDTLRAYGFDNVKVTPVSDAYVTSLTDGGVLQTTFTEIGGSSVYLADRGYRFAFTSAQQCADWGFTSCTDPAYSKSLDPSLFTRLQDGGALKSIQQSNGRLSLMKNGEKNTFLSNQAVIDNGYLTTDAVSITNPLNTRQPYGFSLPENNSFVSFANNPAIYAYNTGKFYPLSSFDVFKSLYSQQTPLATDNFSKYTSVKPVEQPPITPFASTSDGKSYLLTNERKYDITTDAMNWPATQNIDGIQTILNRKSSSGSIAASDTFRVNSGMIFDVQQAKTLPFYSLNDYFMAGNSSPITVSSDIIAHLQQGQTIITPGAGSIYQVTAPENQYSLFTLNNDNTPCQLISMDQVRQYTLSVSSVSRIAPPEGTIKTLNGWIKDETGTSYIVGDGGKTPISAATLSTYWGVNAPNSLCNFASGQLQKTRNSGQSFSRFMRNRNGAIFYGESGKKRPITSYNAFLKLGGNAVNTVTVPDELINAAPTGDPIY